MIGDDYPMSLSGAQNMPGSPDEPDTEHPVQPSADLRKLLHPDDDEEA